MIDKNNMDNGQYFMYLKKWNIHWLTMQNLTKLAHDQFELAIKKGKEKQIKKWRSARTFVLSNQSGKIKLDYGVMTPHNLLEFIEYIADKKVYFSEEVFWYFSFLPYNKIIQDRSPIVVNNMLVKVNPVFSDQVDYLRKCIWCKKYVINKRALQIGHTFFCDTKCYETYENKEEMEK